MLSRVFYAVNWVNIAAIFPLIAADLGQNVLGLGLLTGSFYAGIGLFQIPGGIAAAKIGPRRTYAYGTIAASSACLLVGLASEFYEIMILRFIVGLSMAFVFAPGVTLISKYLRGSEGFGVGILNAAFNVGGIMGLFGWAALAELLGWRISVVASGALGILTGFILLKLIPQDAVRENFLFTYSSLRKILLDRWLWHVALELVAITAGASTITAFVVFYLEESMRVAAALAGLIGAIAYFSGIFASPIFGRLYDRYGNERGLFIFSGLLIAVGLAIASTNSLYGMVISTAIVGFFLTAGATVAFSAARKSGTLDAEYETLAVSWVNCVHFAASLLSPIIFSLVVLQIGYSTAWLLAGLCTVLLISIAMIPKGRTFADRS